MKCPYHPHLDMYVSMSAADNLYACQDTTCTYRGGVTLETIQHDRRMFLGEDDPAPKVVTLIIGFGGQTPDTVNSLVEMLKSGDGEQMETAMQALGVFLGLNMAALSVQTSSDSMPDTVHSPDFLAPPTYWEKHTGIVIADADGWRGPHPARKSFEENITLKEFRLRARLSTVTRPVTGA